MWLTGPVAPWHVGSSQTRARTRVPCIGRQILNHCATREALASCSSRAFEMLFSKVALCSVPLPQTHRAWEGLKRQLAVARGCPRFPLCPWIQSVTFRERPLVKTPGTRNKDCNWCILPLTDWSLVNGGLCSRPGLKAWFDFLAGWPS